MRYNNTMNIDNFRLDQSFGFLINALSLDTKHLLELRLKAHHLTVHQFGILLNISKKGPLTQKEIAQQTNGDEPTTARLMKRLEDKGCIKRVVDEVDKRKRMVSLSPEGTALLEEILPHAQAVNREMLSSLNDAEKGTLISLLHKVLTTSKKYS